MLQIDKEITGTQVFATEKIAGALYHAHEQPALRSLEEHVLGILIRQGLLKQSPHFLHPPLTLRTAGNRRMSEFFSFKRVGLAFERRTPAGLNRQESLACGDRFPG